MPAPCHKYLVLFYLGFFLEIFRFCYLNLVLIFNPNTHGTGHGLGYLRGLAICKARGADLPRHTGLESPISESEYIINLNAAPPLICDRPGSC